MADRWRLLVMDPQQVADERTAWFASRAQETVERGRRLDAALARSLLVESWVEAPDLGAAAVIARIWAWYVTALSPDDIGQRLRQADFIPAGIKDQELLEGLVLPACVACRAKALPFAKWWKVDEIMLSLVAAQLRVAAASGRSDADLRVELRDQWDISNDPVVDAVIETARAPWEIDARPLPRTGLGVGGKESASRARGSLDAPRPRGNRTPGRRDQGHPALTAGGMAFREFARHVVCRDGGARTRGGGAPYAL
jgi:hypothetical protein